MDPRRARDPRLARADPRLQRPQGNLPLPQSQPSQDGDFAMDTEESFPQIEPQPHTASTPTLASNAEEVDSLEAPATISAFNPRPLFCVVCASNQVSLDRPRFTTYNKTEFFPYVKNRSMEGHHVLS